MWWCVKQRIEQELRVQSHFNGLPYKIHVNFWKLKVKWLSCAEAKRMETGIRNLNWRIKPKKVKRKEIKKKSKHTVKWNIQWSYSCVVLIRLCLKLSPTISFLPIKSYSIWFVQTKIVLSKNVYPNSALPLCATFNFESLEAMQMQYISVCVCVFIKIPIVESTVTPVLQLGSLLHWIVCMNSHERNVIPTLEMLWKCVIQIETVRKCLYDEINFDCWPSSKLFPATNY